MTSFNVILQLINFTFTILSVSIHRLENILFVQNHEDSFFL